MEGTSLAERSWGWMLDHAVLPAGDLVFGQRMISRLRFLQSAQWWAADRLHAERDRLLQSVIDTAYREVPFYRELMHSARVKPADIRTPADLFRLPVVTKDMLRSGYPRLTTRPTGQRPHEVHTSGSTGKNFAVMEDARTTGWYLSSFLLSLQWAGWRIGEPQLQTGMTLKRNLARTLKDRLLRCYYVSAFDLDDHHLDAALDRLDRHRINHLWGYAASLYYLALRATAKGWNRPIRSVITWGDNLYPHYRRAIQAAFQTPVFDTYGIGEGIQVAAQCGHGDNYHVHSLDVIVEYLDETGNPVPDGEPGDLILTRLHAGPMPLIRYRVGDVGIRGDQSPCPCGRAFERMQAIQGRDTDVVVTPSGNRLIVEFFNGIIDDFPEIDSFQVIQDRIDSILVTVVPRAGFSSRTGQQLIAAMQQNGATDLRIHVESVPQIPLTAGGKRRYVINRIGRSLTS